MEGNRPSSNISDGDDTEGAATEEDTSLDNALEVSLNAITGSCSPQTMRIHASIRKVPLTVLIGSGSTITSSINTSPKRRGYECNKSRDLR